LNSCVLSSSVSTINLLSDIPTLAPVKLLLISKSKNINLISTYNSSPVIVLLTNLLGVFGSIL
jgi:hypothetical protein